MKKQRLKRSHRADPPPLFQHVWTAVNTYQTAEPPPARPPGQKPGHNTEEERIELLRWRFETFVEKVVLLLKAWSDATPAIKSARLAEYNDFIKMQPESLVAGAPRLGVSGLVIVPTLNATNDTVLSVLIEGCVVGGPLLPGDYSSSSSSSIKIP